MSAELLKSAVERAGRLKVLSWEVLSVSAVSLILAKKEVFSMTAYKEACQNNPKSGYLHLLFFFFLPILFIQKCMNILLLYS